MAEARRSVSCDDLTKNSRDNWLIRKHRLGLKRDSRSNSEDSGFEEHMGDGWGSMKCRVHSTVHINPADECPESKSDQLKRQFEQTTQTGKQTTLTRDTDVIEGIDGSGHLSHGMPKCSKDLDLLSGSSLMIVRRSESEASTSDGSCTSSDRSLDSYIEFTAVPEKENEIFAKEEIERVSCEPQSPPHFPIKNDPKEAEIMLKWPHSIQHMYLRAVEDTEGPKLILDELRPEHEHQYYFTSETMNVVDQQKKTHYLMCFRCDLFGKSFYLVPQGPAGTCPMTLMFIFVEASREDVLGELSHKNSKFWYRFKMNVLESLGHPMYFLSFEKGPNVVLRRTAKEHPETENFNIEIISAKEHSMLWRLRRFIHSLSCIR